MADVEASSGLLLVGVDDPAVLVALRERAALGITERRDEEEGPNTAARFRDPDGRMVVVQLFDPAHRFHH
jgi:hypothetical protein